MHEAVISSTLILYHWC